MTDRSEEVSRSTGSHIDVAPSKHMRLGSGLSSIARTPLLSCFDVELFAEKDFADQNSMSESDLLELFGLSNSQEEKSSSNIENPTTTT